MARETTQALLKEQLDTNQNLPYHNGLPTALPMAYDLTPTQLKIPEQNKLKFIFRHPASSNGKFDHFGCETQKTPFASVRDPFPNYHMMAYPSWCASLVLVLVLLSPTSFLALWPGSVHSTALTCPSKLMPGSMYWVLGLTYLEWHELVPDEVCPWGKAWFGYLFVCMLLMIAGWEFDQTARAHYWFCLKFLYSQVRRCDFMFLASLHCG